MSTHHPPVGNAPNDPAARGETSWLALHAVTAPPIGLLAAVLPLSVLGAAMVPVYWWAVPVGGPVFSPYSITSWGRALTTPLVALCYLGLALLVVPPLARWQARRAGGCSSRPTVARWSGGWPS